MNPACLNVAPTKAGQGLDVVRVAVALVLVVHPLHGIWSQGQWGQDVVDFGQFLGSLGYPMGVATAWSIMVLQLAGVVALLTQRCVVPACLALLGILGAGVWIIHRHAGWFVVGAGTNGMEFSVLLMACLVGLLWAHWPRLKGSATS